MRASWQVLGLLTLGAACAAAQDAGGPAADAAAKKARFSLSRETTYVTEPVRADGTIDYVEAINARFAQGTTRENNAAVPLLEAITWRTPAEAARYAKVRGKLGLPARQAPPRNAAGDFAAVEPLAIEKTFDGPWTENQVPDVAKWLRVIEPRLDRAVEAAGRPRYHMPMVREHPGDSMSIILLTHLNEVRKLVNALRSRAMLRLGTEDAAGFGRNAVAVVRLGRHLEAGPLLIEKLVGIGCQSSGLTTIREAAAGGWLAAADAERLLAELRDTPAAGPMAETFELGERGFMLELFQTAAVHGPAAVSAVLQSMAPRGAAAVDLPPVDAASADWDAALRKANGWYDRLEAAGRLPTHAARAKASAAVDREIQLLKTRRNEAAEASKPFEERVFVLALPTATRAYVVETRIAAERALTETALALSSFRAKTGEFPQSLKELTPAYFGREPADPFADGLLTYRREGGGYVLLSVGQDGKEATGAGGRVDDIVVRVER